MTVTDTSSVIYCTKFNGSKWYLTIYLMCRASSVVSERLTLALNFAVPDNESRLTEEYTNERVFLISISDVY